MDFVLGFVSLAGAILAYLLGFRLVSGLRRSHELAILAHLPISDRDVVRVFQREVLGPGVLLLLPCVLFYATFAVRQQLPGLWALAVTSFGVLKLASVVALGALLSGLLPRRLGIVGGLAVIVAVSTGLAALAMDLLNLAVPIPWAGLALAAKLSLPTGWVNAALQYALIEGRSAAWLMLVPVGLLLLSIPSALERVRSVYCVREVRLVDRETAEAVLEDESLWTGWAHRKRLAATASCTAAPGTDHECKPLDRQVARQRVLSREFLDGWNWQELGWVERIAASVLTPRERSIVEFLLAEPPVNWTRALMALFPAALLGGLVVQFFFGPLGQPGLFASVVPAAAVLAGLSLVKPRVTWTSAERMCSPAVAHVPIGHREVVRACMIVGTVRGLSLLPVAALAGASLLIAGGLNPLQGAMVGVRCTLVAVAIHYWSFLVFRGNVTSHGPALMNLTQMVAYPALAVLFGASAVVLVWPRVGEPWNTLAAGAMFGSGCLVCRYDEWRFNRGTYDLIARPSPEDTTT